MRGKMLSGEVTYIPLRPRRESANASLTASTGIFGFGAKRG
jgi:hypothetical protein